MVWVLEFQVSPGIDGQVRVQAIPIFFDFWDVNKFDINHDLRGDREKLVAQ